ncbi:NAD(P)-dependent alcohol dehydrogenase [Rhizobium leguminosarum]|uniref:zinc-dependent alcohol dehydrogenase family protein n=1 Tax=Rhizobium leguminosarum TaxID=384 RepID=UPI0024A8E3EA|nr:NAD(P)-dependent alcohol dehydrogenase [Rhizobium leguminosarum]MDI5929577.1 NAD(P)-dependent alcohol dehydrogenase [Rhizobium leguminosarum]
MKRYTVNPGTKGSLRIEEIETPSPQRGEVLIRLRAASVNYRDLLVARGAYKALGDRPLVPLSDGAGEVVEVGDGVSNWKVGDRVCGTFSQTWTGGARREDDIANDLGGTAPGVLSEYRVFDARGLVRIPAHLDYAEAATLPCAGVTAWNALYEGRPLRSDETVLLIGTGGVSTFGLQLAVRAGARVVVISSSNEKLAQYKDWGASDVINYRDEPDWEQKVRAATGGRGVDHVLEVGGPGTLERSLATLALGGQIHLIGVLTQGSTNLLPLIRTNSTVRGIMVGSREMFERLNRSLERGAIHPVVHQTYKFEDAPAAFEALERAEHIGKIVISI